ncbi:hypothetical protein [Pedobacter frigidisoli]|uniref:hypothetical protein n=1 Tax=Pedobacter frigidisoli TaxID=2530455 RepID=UPI00292FE706|nr:hypothetical protein [Pedobacter frigidisoli]
MKSIFLLVAMLTSVCSIAQTSGTGCRIGNNIYTEYLGIAYPYGPDTPIRYYKSPGNNVAINYNNYDGSNPPSYYGYKCGQINYFDASSTGPAQREFTDTNTSCIISSTLGGSISGNGVLANYSYNKSAYCTTATMPLPIDDILIPISFLFAGLSVVIIRNKDLAA